MPTRVFVLSVALLVAASATAGQNIVVVLDDSGSMQDTMRSARVRKIDAAKNALLTVLQRLPDDSQVGVVVLNRRRDPWIIPLGPVSDTSIAAAVRGIRANGGTPLGEFMKVGADALLELREKQRYGTYKLLIVTDGEAGDPELVERYLPDIVSRGLAVDVIGVDMRKDHSLATKVRNYRRADDSRALEDAISDVVLGETSSDSGDAGESDFELLATFPDEVAAAILAALVRPGNSPIGEGPAATRQLAQGGGADATTTAPVTGNRPRGRQDVGVWSVLIGMCGTACLVVVGLVVVILVVIAKKK